MSYVEVFWYKYNKTIIPQHYYKTSFFVRTLATKSCPCFCRVRNFTYLSVAKKMEINKTLI